MDVPVLQALDLRKEEDAGFLWKALVGIDTHGHRQAGAQAKCGENQSWFW